MKTNKPSFPFLKRALLGLLSLVMVAGLSLGAYRLISGKPLGLVSFARDTLFSVQSTIKAIAYRGNIQAQAGSFDNIIFLHHSVGENIIREGNFRELVQSKGYQLWDQGYRTDGLTTPDGKPSGLSYTIPQDNTDPDGLARLFSQPAFPLPVNGISQLLQHEVIIVKSCFPVSDILSDEQLEADKRYYLQVREHIDQHPEKLFILLTPPPLNPASGNATTAGRARALANWLTSEEFLAGHANLAVFDLFDVLAAPETAAQGANMLRTEYLVGGDDSHPNAQGSTAAAQQLADFVDAQIQQYQKLALVMK